jgi:hypothetical protein
VIPRKSYRLRIRKCFGELLMALLQHFRANSNVERSRTCEDVYKMLFWYWSFEWEFLSTFQNSVAFMFKLIKSAQPFHTWLRIFYKSNKHQFTVKNDLLANHFSLFCRPHWKQLSRSSKLKFNNESLNFASMYLMRTQFFPAFIVTKYTERDFTQWNLQRS